MVTKRQITGLILLFIVVGSAYFSYGAMMDAMANTGTFTLLLSLAWFIVVLISFSIGALAWQERVFQIVASLVLVLPSFLFALTGSHGTVVIIGAVLVFSALLRINRELGARLKLMPIRTLRASIAPVILALSLVVSSQYYTYINTLPWEQLVPNFNLAEGSGAWLLRVVGQFSPSLATLHNEDLTVDAFLRDLRPADESSGSETVLDPSLAVALREAEMVRSKSQLARLLGRDLNSEERMNDVLSEVLRKKAIAFVSGSTVGTSGHVPFLPFFLAVLLFLTVYPLGSLLAALSVSIAGLLFAVFVRLGLIEIKHIPAEQEVIV